MNYKELQQMMATITSVKTESIDFSEVARTAVELAKKQLAEYKEELSQLKDISAKEHLGEERWKRYSALLRNVGDNMQAELLYAKYTTGILSAATLADLSVLSKYKSAEKALKSAKKYANELGLDMNFVDCYYYLNKSQLIFSFISDTRVDFRELAKKLASLYKTRIELRQIGIRDKAKKIGGIGPCGLFLCCNAFLSEFNSVSINMAKNQNLALNPSKINGLCGRLYCCLGYENDLYTELRKEIPEVGTIVKTPDGKGKVVSIDILKKTYKVEVSPDNIIEMSC